jgi:hypothetical protein
VERRGCRAFARSWRTARALAVLLAAAAALADIAAPAANGRGPSTKEVLERVGGYVVRYETVLSGIVSEEHYVQQADASDRPHITHRELKSDLLLVNAQGHDGAGFVQFRDVFEVDGDQVRDRSQRLERLFVNPTTASRTLAAEIMHESARYNIGSVERNVNVPVLALSFMHPRYQPRFKFTMDAESAGVPSGMPKAGTFSLSVEVRVLTFRETGDDPPLVDSRDPKGRARTRGRIWVEPETGRILMTEIEIDTPTVESVTQVSYQSEPLLGFLVPVEMRETYLMPKRNYRMTGTATYGNFRQFTVKTEESVASPKDLP